jgi:copper chaperone CopZ
MKTVLPFIALIALLACAVQADEVKFSKVHLCCNGCEKAAVKAGTSVEGVKVAVDQDAETLTLSGSSKADLQKAANAVAAAGFYGKSGDADVKMRAKTGAKGNKVSSLQVTGVHLCCGACVKAVARAVEATPGATGHTARKQAKTFEVTGSFTDRDFFKALRDNGLNGRVGS